MKQHQKHWKKAGTYVATPLVSIQPPLLPLPPPWYPSLLPGTHPSPLGWPAPLPPSPAKLDSWFGHTFPLSGVAKAIVGAMPALSPPPSTQPSQVRPLG
jgi:hypothetical protein